MPGAPGACLCQYATPSVRSAQLNIDLIVLRRSTEGLFYSAAVHGRAEVIGDSEVRDIMRITRHTTEKLHDFAFRLARKRRSRGKPGHLTCVDKANVFESQAFFRKIFDERAEGFSDVERATTMSMRRRLI